jgi:hypothetical protein
MTESLKNQPIRIKYRFQHLNIEIPDRSPSEVIEWLTLLVQSVTELCEMHLLSLADVEDFQRPAAVDAEVLAAEGSGKGASRTLIEALQSLDEARCSRAARPSEEQAPRVTRDEWVKWRQYLDHARWACEESCRSWRAELAAGSMPQTAHVLDCVETMEKLLPLLSSWRLEDGPAQKEAADKSALLNAELASMKFGVYQHGGLR